MFKNCRMPLRLMPFLVCCSVCAGADDDFTVDAIDESEVVDIADARMVRIADVQQRKLYLMLFGDTYVRNRCSIEVRTNKRLNEISKQYELTRSEYKSLVLASRLDRIRFDREIAELRAIYEVSKNDSAKLDSLAMTVVEKLSKEQQTTNADSFFEKKISKILASKNPAPRSTTHHQFSSNLLQNRHRADAEAAVRAVERSVKLQQSQRQALVDLLLSETQPAKVFGDFDDVVVKYRMSQIPHEKIQPLFDEDQWPKVLLAIDGFREFGPYLKRHGLLANEPPTVPREPGRETRSGRIDRVSSETRGELR